MFIVVFCFFYRLGRLVVDHKFSVYIIKFVTVDNFDTLDMCCK